MQVEYLGKDSQISLPGATAPRRTEETSPDKSPSADPSMRPQSHADNSIARKSDSVNPPEIRQAKQTESGLTAADKAMLLAAAKKRLYGRPDLAQMGESKQVRALGAEVDQSRNERGEPTPQTFKAWKSNADTRLQKDTTGEWLNLLTGKLHYEGEDAGQNTMVARKLLETKGLEAFASGTDEDIAKVGAAMWG